MLTIALFIQQHGKIAYIVRDLDNATIYSPEYHELEEDEPIPLVGTSHSPNFHEATYEKYKEVIPAQAPKTHRP